MSWLVDQWERQQAIRATLLLVPHVAADCGLSVDISTDADGEVSSCRANGLTPVRVRVVRPPTPANVKGGGAGGSDIWVQRLAVTIVGNRWVHAYGQRGIEPPDIWLPAEYYRQPAREG